MKPLEQEAGHLEPTESADALLDKVDLSEAPLTGVVIGELVGLNEGAPLVEFPGNVHGPLQARSTVAVSVSDMGREVTLMFAGGRAHEPIVTGLLQPEGKETVDVIVDGKRLILRAEQELVLQCGEASITLTEGGKVLVRGTHLVNHASGVNRIKGGSVRIN